MFWVTERELLTKTNFLIEEIIMKKVGGYWEEVYIKIRHLSKPEFLIRVEPYAWLIILVTGFFCAMKIEENRIKRYEIEIEKARLQLQK